MTKLVKLKRRLSFLTLLLLIACAAGCGPGFPIMTKEQEDLVANVNRLVKENESIKTRLTAVESRDNGSDIKQEINALKLRIAGMSGDMDKLRQDFAFAQGAIETDAHDKTQAKEALKAIAAAMTQTNDRVSAMEKTLHDITASIEAHDKKIAELQNAKTATSAPVADLTASTNAAQASADGATATAKTPEDLYAIGYNNTVEKRFDEAITALNSFLSIYPEHKLASNAQYWLGEVYYAKGDYERAILEFDKVVKNYPKADKSASAMLKEGYSFEKIGSTKEAKVLLQNVIDKFPSSSEADIASKRLKTLK